MLNFERTILKNILGFVQIMLNIEGIIFKNILGFYPNYVKFWKDYS
jgi:hypothetical protein